LRVSTEEHTVLQKKIADVIIAACADSPWARADVSAVLVGDEIWFRWGVTGENGRPLDLESPPPFSQLETPVVELQQAMHDREVGTWLSVQIAVQANGSFAFTFNYDEPVYAGGHPGAPLQRDSSVPESDESPTLEDYRQFIQEFPRSASNTPAWMTGSTGQAGSEPWESNAAEIERKLAAPMSVPARFEDAVAHDNAWGKIFASVQSNLRSVLADQARSGGLPLEDPARLAGDLDVLIDAIESAVFAETLAHADTNELRRVLDAAGGTTVADEDTTDKVERLISSMVSQVMVSIFGVEPVS